MNVSEEERAAAYALVERELHEIGPLVDVRMRRAHVVIEALERVDAPTLREAVDRLKRVK